MNRGQIAFLTVLVIGALLIAGAFIIRAADIAHETPTATDIQLPTL